VLAEKLLLEVALPSEPEMKRHGIALALELAPNLPPALADPVQIRQVIGNLLINAIEAMAAKPGIAHTLKLASHLQDGALVLRVEDTGIGIPEATRAHLFDAFWTTKPDGTGVGLSISRTMIEANGGQLWAEPRSSAGAVFHLRLPVAPAEPPR